MTRMARRGTDAAVMAPHGIWLLIGGIALAAAPHVQRVPIWVTSLACAALLWRSWATWKGDRLPRRWLLIPLTLLTIVGIYLSYRTLLGRDAGVTLLIVLLAFKMLEARQPRDVALAVMMSYFLALTAFFYSQSPVVAVLTLLTIFLLTAALVASSAKQRPKLEPLRTAGMLLLQGIPLMVMLFLLFPRIQGPLWGMPADAFGGRTGLSDTMTPGAISQLSQSEDISFRVKFDGEAPQRRDLYWRGPVLRDFDGRTWRPGGAYATHQRNIAQAQGPTISYEVTLEAHNRPWLFMLDLAVELPERAVSNADYQVMSREPVRQRQRYRGTSALDYRAMGGATPHDLIQATILPRDSNPRAHALADQWRRQAGSDAEIIALAIRHFQRGAYVYTLNPPIAGEHSVDEFLFDTRRGFCEHFSSAFAVLMRAAGIPSRIVTGYQGGEVNPLDGFVTVRQSDAHAWTEVWLEEQGWIRIDPTATAVPLRAEQGLSAALPAGEAPPVFLQANLPWLHKLRLNVEALSNYWNQWVIGYDMERQRELLTRLGMPAPSWQNVAVALFWTLGLAVLLLWLWLLRRVTYSDPAQMAWLSFCAKLRRRNIVRRPHEGPQAFAARAAKARPSRARAIADIADLYTALRYGSVPDEQRLAQLRTLVRRFAP